MTFKIFFFSGILQLFIYFWFAILYGKMFQDTENLDIGKGIEIKTKNNYISDSQNKLFHFLLYSKNQIKTNL